jgi:hypothetical protein
MAAEQSRAPATDMSLRALKLRPGMFVQTQTTRGDGESIEAKFCAAIEGKGLMLVPLPEGRRPLKDGEPHRLRGFTGIFDFAFDSQVIQSFTHPFAYTLFAWPATVKARRVRSALRIPTALPVQVDAPAGPRQAIIVDLSCAGAMLRSVKPIGAVGSSATLGFSITVDERPFALVLSGTICHSAPCDSGDGYRTGFAFGGVGRNERIALQNFTYAAADDAGMA